MTAQLDAAFAQIRVLQELIAEQRGGLQAVVHRLRMLEQRQPEPSREAIRLLLLLPARWKGDAFSTNQVIEQARLLADAEMQDALANARATTPHRLAKVFRLLEDRTFSGYRLKRIGSERDGITWCLLRD